MDICCFSTNNLRFSETSFDVYSEVNKNSDAINLLPKVIVILK